MIAAAFARQPPEPGENRISLQKRLPLVNRGRGRSILRRQSSTVQRR
jgi:hypothetical protein